MLKDIWFYLKDFFKKGPLYVLVFCIQILIASGLVFSVIELTEIIAQLLGNTEPIFSKEDQLTQEELYDSYFVVSHLITLISIIFICLGILRFLKWILKKAGIITKENPFIKPPKPKQPLW